jgi:hypothetical protein
MRAGEGLNRSEFVQDRRQNSSEVLLHIGVVHADHLEAKSLKLSRALFIT